jgi:transcriptional regulator with XRE-family HTH domain
MARPRFAQLDELGHAIRMQRTRRRLTQDRAAVRAGMHRSQFGAIERGENNPTFLTLVRIAGALGVPVDRLIRDAIASADDDPGAREPR